MKKLCAGQSFTLFSRFFRYPNNYYFANTRSRNSVRITQGFQCWKWGRKRDRRERGRRNRSRFREKPYYVCTWRRCWEQRTMWGHRWLFLWVSQINQSICKFFNDLLDCRFLSCISMKTVVVNVPNCKMGLSELISHFQNTRKENTQSRKFWSSAPIVCNNNYLLKYKT